jgi:hypothetical protein
VIVRGREFEPQVYPQLYDDLVNKEITKEVLVTALKKMYEYLDSLDLQVYRPILDFITEEGGIVTQSKLVDHFRNMGLGAIELENLHRRKIVRRTISPIRLTKRGIVEYNEPQYHFDWNSFDPNDAIPTKLGPSDVEHSKVVSDYEKALADFVEKAKQDDYILSFMLGGSLSYDSVWEKSDIDILIVTRDDVFTSHPFVLENDVLFDVQIMPRDAFRRVIQRATDGSVLHSYFSKSKLIFTKDDSIHDIYEDYQNVGLSDLEDLLLLNYVFCKDLMNKATKALFVKDDHRFSVSFIMSAILRLANIEVLLNRAIPLRESVGQALVFNPDLFEDIFTDMITKSTKDKASMARVLERMEVYLDDKLEIIVQPILRLLAKDQEVTHYDLKTHFSEIGLPIDLTDFVARGFFYQTESPFRLTKKSTTEMNQPAYHLSGSTSDRMMGFEI